MKLSNLYLMASNDYIKPKLTDLKIGDLVFFKQTYSTQIKTYCKIHSIKIKTPESITVITGTWDTNKKHVLESGIDDNGFMHLKDIFKVV